MLIAWRNGSSRDRVARFLFIVRPHLNFGNGPLDTRSMNEATDAVVAENASPASPRRRPTVASRWLIAPELQSSLVSLAVHLTALILLALLMIVPERRPSSVLLDCEFERGFDTKLVTEEVAEPMEFEAPPAVAPMELASAAEPFEAPVALAVAVDLSPRADEAPETAAVFGQQATLANMALFAGRDPDQRAALARRGGGNELSERSVDLGLQWLADHQSYEGNWSLDAFELSPHCQGRCTGQGHHSDTAATALALLPFLGAGETQHRGRYQERVERGLTWLVNHQVKNGNMAGAGVGRMYAHAQGTLVLCEALAMTHDSYLREPAQAAVKYLVKAQHRRGGWRYEPGQPGDVSVTGWALMALRSAKLAGIEVPTYVWARSGRFLDSTEADSLGSQYSYMPKLPPTNVMTAEALLCRQYAGWRPTRPAMRKGLDQLLDQFPPQREAPNIYYWYYGTQLMHHAGGEHWRRWNYLMRDILVETQETGGHQRGSWPPVGPFSMAGGRLYMTSLALCTLEVYYRHMPLYQQQAVEGSDVAVAPVDDNDADGTE